MEESTVNDPDPVDPDEHVALALGGVNVATSCIDSDGKMPAEVHLP